MKARLTERAIIVSGFAIFFLSCGPAQQPAQVNSVPSDLINRPYELNTGLVSRSISFENSTGAPGESGKAASRLGVGRKGSPSRSVKPDSTFVLCDIEGAGTIRHIWMTTSRAPENLRSIVLRVWWDDQEHPSIECPVGDFMGFAHGRVMPYYSAVHSCGSNAGMNIWLPMPFTKRAKITFTNEGTKTIPLFYQIDYTIGDRHSDDVGRLHCLFRRENPTTLKEDFTILPKRTCKGRFIGAVLGIRYEDKNWWGEGEIKIFMDGDTEFPTICGTGSEDYVGLSYGMQQTPFLYNGCSLNDPEKGFVSMYRWHLPDPIYWREECRITIQQIGWSREVEGGLYERRDDWSAATFWYEPVPGAPLPEMPGLDARTTDIWQ
jgi:hypothetical protein